jgi:hypothetical protein
MTCECYTAIGVVIIIALAVFGIIIKLTQLADDKR